MRTASGGHQFVGDDAVIGHELDILQALLAQLAYQRASLRVQAAEVDHVGTGGADLGNHGAEVFLATGQAFVQHRLHAAFFQLRLGGVGQALAVGVLVVQHRDFLALEHIDNVVAGHDALLVVTAAHAEHGAQAAFGHLRVGGAWGDGDNAGFVIHLGGRDGVGGTEVADHADHLVLVDQAVGHGYGLLRLAGVIAFYQDDFFAIHAAGGVDLVGRCLRTFHVLLAKRCVRPGHRARYTDLDVGLNIRRNTQCCSHGQSQETFLVKRLRHEVVLLEFFLVGTTTSQPCAQSKGRAIGFVFRENTLCWAPAGDRRPFLY